MKYCQRGQGWIDATVINLALAGLLIAIVALYLVVKCYELGKVVKVQRHCGHCRKVRHFSLFELWCKNCFECRRTIRISIAINKKYGG